MSQSLLILGAGGHGRVVADTAAMAGWDKIAFLDDNATASSATCWPVIGPIESLVVNACMFDAAIVAIADCACREALMQQLDQAGVGLATVIAPSAVVSPRASIAPGCMILAGAVVQIGAKIGAGCIVNTSSTVDHDCELGPCVHVAPGAHVAGAVTIGARSWIGLGATVNENLTLGEACTVGASAAVVTDVAPGATVMGVPARAVVE